MFDGTSGKRAAIARVGNWVTMTIVIGYYFASFFVTIFQCTPVEKSWKPRLQGHCINMKAFFYTTGGVNVLTSALIITLPLFVLLQTTQRRSEVSQLLGLIMLGVVDTITSIGRLFTLTSASALNSDRTWTLINSTTASAIELSIMVMAASLVSMRPHIYVLYCALFPRAARRDGGHHHPSAAAATRDGYALHTGSYGHSATDHCSTGEGAATKPPRGIVKTTQIELSSLSVSTENILRNDDRF
ncbi:MAG: hypothetical protein M1818_003758 [Claussenomyces sp. TS43310]|nr:MAG: hypothetical protein M1818_003758 [Claussenomyces sp. TS43310]